MTLRTLCHVFVLASIVLAATVTAWSHAAPASAPPPAPAAGKLKPAAAFNGIKDRNERAVALFVEAGKVINHPRCLNCHPGMRSPTQGDDLHPHSPPINAGMAGMGQPGLFCISCHQAKNVSTPGTGFRSIPGHAHWMLAPSSMAWQGKTLGEICQQLKDTTRNGGRNLQQIRDHMGKDTLVGWAWRPGEGRTPAPGTQDAFGKLIGAWIDNGADCPP